MPSQSGEVEMEFAGQFRVLSFRKWLASWAQSVTVKDLFKRGFKDGKSRNLVRTIFGM